jgi:hypothetical protein
VTHRASRPSRRSSLAWRWRVRTPRRCTRWRRCEASCGTHFTAESGSTLAIFTDPCLFLGGDEVGPSCFAQHLAMVRWMKEHHMNGSQLENHFWGAFGEQVACAR